MNRDDRFVAVMLGQAAVLSAVALSMAVLWPPGRPAAVMFAAGAISTLLGVALHIRNRRQ
jgi:hypothetical protein